MKQYIGLKAVQAEPCMKDGKEGYKVVYADGYESWSPKDVFEKSYVLVPDELIQKEGVSPQQIVDEVLREYRDIFKEDKQ